MKRFEIFFGVIKVPLDFIMTILAFLAAYQLRLITEPINGLTKPIDYSVLPTIHEYFKFSIYAALALIAIFALGQMYILKVTSKFSRESKNVAIFCGIWAMTIITYFFFTRTFPFSRLAIFYSWALTFIFIFLGRAFIRLIQKILLNHGIGQRRLIFIGNNSITKEIAEKLSRDPSYKILGIMDKFEETMEHKSIDEIIQTKSDFPQKQDENILEF